ncbi:MAG: tetratricopeptide repeat protein [Deltaproteobacteria bacterium]|nr:tetratricopeptide repeat protein [Deltaproteobacteria bacterium]
MSTRNIAIPLAFFLSAAFGPACGDDHPTTTPTPGPGGSGSGSSGGTTTGGGTGTEGTSGGATSGAGGSTATTPPPPPDSPLEAGVDEALAAGSGASTTGRELIPLSASESSSFQQGVEAFEQRGDANAARSAFEAVLVSNPTAYRAAYNLGYLAERGGDNREAILNYQRALDIKPDYPTALRALFRLLDRLGRASEGLSQVQSRAAAFPGDNEMQAILAEAYIAAGRANEGVVIARRMLIADANSMEAFRILLRASIEDEQTALTLELLKRIADKLTETVPFENCSGGGTPEDRAKCRLWSYVKFTYGQIAASEGRKVEAKRYYEEAIDADPTFVEARVLVAGFQLDAGQLAPATENLEEARKVAPSWLPVLVGLGNAYRGLGRYADAMTALREAERLYPSSPEVPIGIGMVYYDARTQTFEGLDRAQADQSALDAFRRAQGMGGAGADTELAALIAAAQADYDFATAPPPEIPAAGGWGEEGGGTEGGTTEGGDGWGGGWDEGGGATEGGTTEGGGTEGGTTEGGGGDEWGGGGW